MRLKKIFIIALTICVFVGASGAALAKSAKDTKDTILDTLERTDGSQAAVAAIRFVDGSGDCRVRIEQLLDDKKRNWFSLRQATAGLRSSSSFLKMGSMA